MFKLQKRRMAITLIAALALLATVATPIILAQAQVGEIQTDDFVAKFNPTGTHVKDGRLKVRIDIYPNPGTKTYDIHHIEVPVIPPEGYPGEVDKDGNPLNYEDYETWLESLPKVWQTNPFLCHFIVIDKDMFRDALEQYVKEIFDQATLTALDDELSKVDQPTIYEVNRIMSSKTGSDAKLSISDDPAQIISTVNQRFEGLEIGLGAKAK